MKKSITLLLLLVASLSLFAAGTWVGWRGASRAKPQESVRHVLHYTCPMHPQYHSDKPGDCPSCGMRLEPVYAGEGGAGSESRPSASAVRVTPDRQQAIGIRVATAERTPSSSTFRTVGRIAADDRRLYRINASTEFWVRKTYEQATGSYVKRNDPILGYYSTNFLSAAAAYLYALDTVDRQKAAKVESAGQKSTTDLQVRQAVESLQNLGVSEPQLQEMAATRKVSDLVVLRAPIDGFVVSRSATLGQYIAAGTELFQLADLSRVWVLADVFESQADLIKPGMAVTVSMVQRKREFRARVSDVQPLFDEASRTLKFRIEADNPAFLLKPGMFVDVEFPVTLPAAVTVPGEAVVDSGVRRTVYVDRGNGYFEPRRVATGWRMGDRVQIVSGLQAGERIAVSGTFLLDSESRMRSAAAGIASPETDPVCGMDVDRD